MRCGCRLSSYTVGILAGAAFCTSCIADQQLDCLHLLLPLAAPGWFGILVEQDGVIYLAPLDQALAGTGIDAVAATLAFRRQYGSPVAAKR